MRLLKLSIILAIGLQLAFLAEARTVEHHHNKRIFGSIGNWINDNIVKPIVNPVVDHVINPIGNLIGVGGGGNQNEDLCAKACVNKVKLSENNVAEFFLDRSHGCVSKGFLPTEYKSFDKCCDAHNYCLSSQCCTNDCQSRKDACDMTMFDCMREDVCFHLYHDKEQYKNCMGRVDLVMKQLKVLDCNQGFTQNKKLCYCHIKP